jgi:DNA-binding CsgD family transcriptional regulator
MLNDLRGGRALALTDGIVNVALGRFDDSVEGLARVEILNAPMLRVVVCDLDPLTLRRGMIYPHPHVVVMDADALRPAGRRLLLARGLPNVPVIALRSSNNRLVINPGPGVSFVGELERAHGRLAAWITALAALTDGTIGDAYPSAVIDPPQLELTRREVQVCQLICEGRHDWEIATELVIAIGTVHAHVKSIFRKLGVDRTELTVRSWSFRPRETSGQERSSLRPVHSYSAAT